MARGSKTSNSKSPAKKSAAKSKKSTGSAKQKIFTPDAGKTGSLREHHSSGRNPVYVLVILILITAIVILVNRMYFNGTRTSPQGRDLSIKTARVDDKKTSPLKDNTSGTETDPKKIKDAEDKKTRKPDDLLPEREFKLYYLRFDERTEKTMIVTVRRKLKTDQPVAAAIRELIKGPGVKEEKTGLLSALPRRLVVRDISVKNRIATINFNEALEEGASGSIAQNRVDQIVYTATQFEEVSGVILQMNVKTIRFLGGDGLALNIPLTRKPGGK